MLLKVPQPGGQRKGPCRTQKYVRYHVCEAILPVDHASSKVIEDAEREGLLQPYTNSRIFEGTVGSTGISIATIARARYVYSSPRTYSISNDDARGYDASEIIFFMSQFRPLDHSCYSKPSSCPTMLPSKK